MTKIKWIFALNDEAIANYGDLVRVAVQSASIFDSLIPILLFDGVPGEFTREMEDKSVQVVFARSRFYDAMAAIAEARQSRHWLSAGPFLRLEIPRLARELGWLDPFVFYTDVDVIFQRDPTPLLVDLEPRYFACAGENFVNKPLYMNTGAMWMNLEALQRIEPQFEAWTRANLEACLDFSFDQGAFRVFFNPLHRACWKLGISNSLFYGVNSRLPIPTWQWDVLPDELNWKPYWEPNPNAAIIHFHGLKPTSRQALERGELEPFIARLHTPYWDECASRWDELLAEAHTL